MNYYNPYFGGAPFYTAAAPAAKAGLFSRLFGGTNLSTILTGTQKVLNIANQAIPLVKQATPLVKNAKTMFRVMNEFKKVDTPTSANSSSNTTTSNVADQPSSEDISTNVTSENGPTFFL